MKVKAKEDCFVDDAYRSEGTVFEYTPRKKKDGKTDIIPRFLEPVVPAFKEKAADPEVK